MKAITLAIIFVGIASLILFTSIDVSTLFAGQHTFVDISDTENDISCVACHHRIQEELDNSSLHKDLTCEDCHRFTGTGITFAEGGSPTTSGEEAHAAYTPRCLDCHGGGGYAKQAPAFNESGYGSNVSAHKPLVKQALEYNLSVGENEACLACHTNYSIKFEFRRPGYFDFTWNKGSGDSGKFTLSNIGYGPTNYTHVLKSESGAKHEFKALNQIKCEDCHSDIWQAANHSESTGHGSTRASHVCWKWYKSGSGGGGGHGGEDPMHNVTCVYSEYGISYYYDYYDNITEYCMLSCHKPRINPSATIPPVFQETAHAAYRLSCYHCHNNTAYSNAFWSIPRGQYDTPEFEHSGGHDTIDNEALSEPLFLQAETCISCKRSGERWGDGTYKTYTEPNNTMLYGGTPI
jgi:hypothetical protein